MSGFEMSKFIEIFNKIAIFNIKLWCIGIGITLALLILLKIVIIIKKSKRKRRA